MEGGDDDTVRKVSEYKRLRDQLSKTVREMADKTDSEWDRAKRRADRQWVYVLEFYAMHNGIDWARPEKPDIPLKQWVENLRVDGIPYVGNPGKAVRVGNPGDVMEIVM